MYVNANAKANVCTLFPRPQQTLLFDVQQALGALFESLLISLQRAEPCNGVIDILKFPAFYLPPAEIVLAVGLRYRYANVNPFHIYRLKVCLPEIPTPAFLY